MGMFNRTKLVYFLRTNSVHKMYHMEERDSIILSYRREGLSIREIARRRGMSRKTVRKYLREFERAVGDNPDLKRWTRTCSSRCAMTAASVSAE